MGKKKGSALASAKKRVKTEETSSSASKASALSITSVVVDLTSDTPEDMDLPIEISPSSVIRPNFQYIQKNHFQVNLAPDDGFDEMMMDRDYVTAVVNSWVSIVPSLAVEKNRDPKFLIKDLIVSSSFGGLPAFGAATSTTNTEFRSCLLQTIHRITQKPAVEVQCGWIKRLIEGFRDCQQVQFRTVTGIYMELCGNGSLHTRINNLLQCMKRKWLQQLMLFQHNGHRDSLNPHMESEYLIALGDAIGVVEHSAATNDKLINAQNIQAHQMNKKALIDKFVSFISTDEIVDATMSALRVSTECSGQHIDEDSLIVQTELRTWLESHNMYNANSYDEDGNVQRDAVVKILVASNVLLVDDEPGGDNNIAVGDGNEEITDLFAQVFTPSECTNPLDAEEFIVERNLAFEISLTELPMLLINNIATQDLTDREPTLTVKAVIESVYTVSTTVDGPEPVRSFLDEILQLRLQAQRTERVLQSLYWIDDSNIQKLRTTLIADLCRCCVRCPVCNAEHGQCVTTLMPCPSTHCVAYFTDRNIGRLACKIIERDPQVMELLISMTYWAGSAGLMAHPPPKPPPKPNAASAKYGANGGYNNNTSFGTTVVGASASTLAPAPAPWTEQVADMDFNPFPNMFAKFSAEGKLTGREYIELLETLNKIPSAEMLRLLHNNDRLEMHFAQDDYLEKAGYMLRWIANSMPTKLEFIPEGAKTEWERTFFNNISKTKPVKYLFRVMNPPEKITAFEQARDALGGCTEFLFHGSALSKWFSILRHSLMVCSGTKRMVNGAVYGNGIYLGKTFDLSLGYSANRMAYMGGYGYGGYGGGGAAAGGGPDPMALAGSGWWNCGQYISWCVLVVECVQSPQCQTYNAGGIVVANSSDVVISRYLVCG